MILTDGIHVVSTDSLHELHSWAADHCLPRRRYHRSRWPHYDLPRSGHWTAAPEWKVRNVTSRELIWAMRAGAIMREIRREAL